MLSKNTQDIEKIARILLAHEYDFKLKANEINDLTEILYRIGEDRLKDKEIQKKWEQE